jgi:xanthine/CO dehydrogenase XdhC/CoxF family maturation factor
MTHDFAADAALLGTVLRSPAGYVGVLGPRQRTDRLLDAVRSEGPPLEPWQLERLHAPVGLDIDAETPEEIALSIVAEIQASFCARAGGPLRDRATPIHGVAPAEPAPVDFEQALAVASSVSRSSSV